MKKHSTLPVPLTPVQARRLAELERVLALGQRQTGEALSAILRERLYRGTCRTFGDYCRQRWQMSRQRGYQLVQLARVTSDLRSPYLSTMVDKSGHANSLNERQARELASLPACLRERVYSEATADGARTTTAAELRELTVEAIAALSPELQAELVRVEQVAIQGRREAGERREAWDAVARRIDGALRVARRQAGDAAAAGQVVRYLEAARRAVPAETAG